MRVLVCGGRDFRDVETAFAELDRIDREHGIAHVIHGAAPGADTLAGEWAAARCKWVTEFPADWVEFGRAAGPIRNRLMLTQGKPELVIAFPGGRGTANMISQAEKAGLMVIRI